MESTNLQSILYQLLSAVLTRDFPHRTILPHMLLTIFLYHLSSAFLGTIYFNIFAIPHMILKEKPKVHLCHYNYSTWLLPNCYWPINLNRIRSLYYNLMTPEKQVLSEIPSMVGYGYFLEPDNIGWVAYVLKAGFKILDVFLKSRF